MSFLNKMNDVLENEFNVSVTENGALGFRTTGKDLLDLSYSVSSLRRMEDAEVVRRFAKAFRKNKYLSIKWLFFASDVREGQGERRLLRLITRYLAGSESAVMRAILPLLPEYTRWDNVVELVDSEIAADALQMIADQLKSDLCDMEEKKSISLLAKWLPSNNASSARSRALAHIVSEHLSMTNAEYRKTLVKLRAYIDLVEVKMSARRFGEINYETVPSRANVIYRNAFLRNDETRRRKFLEALKSGNAKINAGVLYPHDIVYRYFHPQNRYMVVNEDATLEELWRALPDYVNGAANTLCVADGSGSMFAPVDWGVSTSAISVAIALAIYFSERTTGEFKDKYISFSNDPQLVDLSPAKSLHDKIEIARTHCEVATTDIEAVFDLVLLTAIKFKMKQEELPKNILILSDMEFNNAATVRSTGSALARLFDVMRDRYRDAGYKLPRLVFWNIAGRTITVPMRENECGLALVSGFSPTTMRMVLSEKLDPYECLLEQLMAPRYNAVDEAIRAAGLKL